MNEMEWNKQQNHEGGQQKQSTAQNRVVLLHPKKGAHAGCALDKSCFQVVCSMWKRQSPLSNRIRFSLSNDTRLTVIGSGSIHAPPREDTESSTASFLPAATARMVCSFSIHAKPGWFHIAQPVPSLLPASGKVILRQGASRICNPTSDRFQQRLLKGPEEVESAQLNRWVCKALNEAVLVDVAIRLHC